MPADGVYVGVDWSEDGWLAVAFRDESFDHATVFESVGECWARYEETAACILLDVPIGLRADGTADRPCDRAARAVVGPRAAAIVTPPVREAARKRRYQAAARVTERKGGSDLSRAAFAMSDAITAVDQLVREIPAARDVLAESHPELCFRALADSPLEYPGDTAGGYAERMRTLAEYDPDAPVVVQTVADTVAGQGVSVAAVLDAVALAYTARPGAGPLRWLPPDPPTDASGLRMGMRYRAAEPLAAASTSAEE